MANLSGVIYLSNEDFRTLATTGTVVIGSDTLTYDPNTIYITPDVLASATEDGLMSASDKSKLDTINLSNLVTTNTAQTISGVKTFSAGPVLNNNIGLQWKDSSGTAVDVLQLSSSNNLIANVPGGIASINATFRPYDNSDATYDLGKYVSSSKKARWKNLYLSGNLSDGTNSVSIANIVKKSAALTANQFVVGNGGADVKISAMKPTTSSTTWDSTSDVNVPTMKAISTYVQAQIQAAITTALNTPV